MGRYPQRVIGSLDYIYAPSRDAATDARLFVDTMGAELVFAIERSGTRVALLRVGTGGRPGVVEAMAGQIDF